MIGEYSLKFDSSAFQSHGLTFYDRLGKMNQIQTVI